jgi:hypothetical protein
MIVWKPNVPPLKQLIYWIRQQYAQSIYFDHFALKKTKFFMPLPQRVWGHQSRIANLHNTHLGQRCFIICNGPSLASMELKFLRNEITIGCNGIYKKFKEWGFHVNYLICEDVEQFEIRASDLSNINGPIKMAAIFNAYALRNFKGWLFFNSPRCFRHSYYWDENQLFPQFSKDFASVVYPSHTVTYTMLQLAYFLGCSEVYIIGLDHNYGKLPKLFPPGKIKVTEDNYALVQECHFNKNYYKIGDVMGVPHVTGQELGYQCALDHFNKAGRTILNLTPGSKLDVFPKSTLDQLNLS